MLSIVVLPVLKCMSFLHSVVLLILTASYHIGQTILLIIIEACNILLDVLGTIAIIGEELYRFLCELNASLAVVSSYVKSSANGGLNCAIEAIGIFIKHIAKFFVNTRLHSKLLTTFIGSTLVNLLNLFRNALLLIADCAWWLITLLPRWLLYAIIAAGDFIVDTITSVRKVLVNAVSVIVDDVFRLTIGLALLFLVFHNRTRLFLVILRCILLVKRFLYSCCLYLRSVNLPLYRLRANRTIITPLRNVGIQRRSPLPRSSIATNYCEKVLDITQRCVICKDRQKCVLLLPCKHLCLCEECADYMFFSTARQNCPLCRTFVDHSMSVYI